MSRLIGASFEEKGFLYRNIQSGTTITAVCETTNGCRYEKVMTVGFDFLSEIGHNTACIVKGTENRIHTYKQVADTAAATALTAARQASAASKTATEGAETAKNVAKTAEAAAKTAEAAAKAAEAAAKTAKDAAVQSVVVAAGMMTTSVAAIAATRAAEAEKDFWDSPGVTFHVMECLDPDNSTPELFLKFEPLLGGTQITLPYPLNEVGDQIRQKIQEGVPRRCEVALSQDKQHGLVLELCPTPTP